MKRILLRLAGLLLLLLLCEGYVRLDPAAPIFYQQAAIEAQKLDYLFVGSSRVGAGIDAEHFRALMRQARAGQEVGVVLNLGMGYSTAAEHALGLKRLWEQKPQSLRGATVFVETLQGVGMTDTWRDSWTHEGWPDLIIPVLGFGELISFLWESGSPRNDKIYVATGTVSQAALSAVRLRKRFWAQGNLVLSEQLNKLRSDAEQRVDLTAAAGVRTDADGVSAARKLAMKIAEEQLQNQQSLGTWEQSIMATLARFVTAHGGSVVFFPTPMSSVEKGPWTTAVRTADRAQFEREARSWGAVVIDPGFQAPDSDFPDLWHLSHSRRGDYTEAVARAYLGRP